MNTFDDRKKAAEAKFKHDQEAYAKQVVMADFEEPGDDDVVRKVRGDLTEKGIEADDHLIRTQMERLLDEAKSQVSAE